MTLRSLAPGGRSFGTRQMSTALNSVLQYLRSDECRRLQETQPALVEDVVRSSGSHFTGLEAARLAIAHSEHQLDVSDWRKAFESAENAISYCSGWQTSAVTDGNLACSLQQAGKELRHRCLLASGDPDAALSEARNDSKLSASLPDSHEAWQCQIEAATRLGHVCLALGKTKEAHGAMQQARELDEQPSSRLEDGSDADYDSSVLPMKPRDISAPTAIYRLGIFSFVKGQVSRSSREFQRAAMAAEAAHAQAVDASDQPVSVLLLRETSLSAFSGHAQSGLFRAQTMKQWKHSEEQLEKVLAQAEAISGDRHPRVLISLMHLAEAFTFMGKLTLAEGLYRSVAQSLWSTARDPANAALQPSGIFHSSLSCLHAWRYAQLLDFLPKREAECNQWKRSAQQQAQQAASLFLPDLEAALGAITFFRNASPKGTGVFVDNSCRLAIPCLRSLVSGRRQDSSNE